MEHLNEKKATGFSPALAWWISPSGKILGFSTTKHINIVREQPEAFGLTKEGINEIYKKFKEPLGFEGKARDAIMNDLITNKGWIRIRHYTGKNDFYTIQLGDLDSTRKDYLWWWANAELNEGESPNSWPQSVRVMVMNKNQVIQTGLNEIVNEQLLNESEKKDYKKRLSENTLQYIEKPVEFLKINNDFLNLCNKRLKD